MPVSRVTPVLAFGPNSVGDVFAHSKRSDLGEPPAPATAPEIATSMPPHGAGTCVHPEKGVSEKKVPTYENDHKRGIVGSTAICWKLFPAVARVVQLASTP